MTWEFVGLEPEEKRRAKREITERIEKNGEIEEGEARRIISRYQEDFDDLAEELRAQSGVLNELRDNENLRYNHEDWTYSMV